MTLGEYSKMLNEYLSRDPDRRDEDLYSEDGIPFGYVDHEVLARKFGISEYEVRVMVNGGLIEGIKSNDHLIVPANAKKPKKFVLPKFPIEEDYDDGRYSGLISE